ncbi:hypothetical protein Tco_1279008, partial [Tanacetum coccineum]
VRDADLEARRFEKVEVNHDYEGLNMVEIVKELVEGENGLIDDVVVETVKESDVVENGLIDDVVVKTVEESDVVENGLIGDVVVETVKESVEVESGLIDDVVVHDEKESEVLEIDTDVILDDMWSKQEHTDHLQRVDELQEHESAETEVMEIDDIEVKREVSDQLLTADFDQDGFGEDMNLAEKVIGDIKPSELASSDPAKEEETMSVTSVAPKEELSKETSHVNAPSVELLGEFVFGEELTSSVRSDNILPEANASNSLIQTSSVSFSQTTTSHLEISTRTARKPAQDHGIMQPGYTIISEEIKANTKPIRHVSMNQDITFSLSELGNRISIDDLSIKQLV